MFAFEATEDGSPTVRIQTGESSSEAMHSLKGAFSETVYIYGTAIETALEKGFPPSVLCMGLGLGYVEILSAALFLKHGVQGTGESFEIVPELRDWFAAWAKGDRARVPAEFADAYDWILDRTARETAVAPETIARELRAMLETGRWRIREALTPETTFETRFGCICFDAFSSKSTPDLWQETFLTEFLARAADPRCVLSTYACTGALKRSLKGSGFDLTIREGFSSKRDSTFAVRG